MIGFEMEMPERCENCPCSYYIRTGAYRDRLMCEVLEKTEPGAPVDRYLVEEYRPRQEKCPMREMGTEYRKGNETDNDWK